MRPLLCKMYSTVQYNKLIHLWSKMYSIFVSKLFEMFYPRLPSIDPLRREVVRSVSSSVESSAVSLVTPTDGLAKHVHRTEDNIRSVFSSIN